MPDPNVILEADGLRVVFFRRGDRYAHRVEVFDVTGKAWVAAFESLEGEPGDEWPPSPPWQQLHVERRPTGPVAFLIGMAGRTHWSAAVEVSADRKSIAFDVAARLQVSPVRLGCEYTAGVETGAPADAIRVETTSPLVGDGLRIAADLTVPAPTTIAWKYALAR